MSEEVIIAMQYGSRSPLDERAENNFARYGLGMKTDSLSQDRILPVISKKDGKVLGAQWNLNHIRQAEIWSLIVLEEDEIVVKWEKLSGYDTGTLVERQGLDKFSIDENDIAAIFTRKIILLELIFYWYFIVISVENQV